MAPSASGSSSEGPSSGGVQLPRSSSPSTSSSSEKRAREEGDIPDDGHDANGRKKPSPAEHPWKKWGRGSVRLFDAFTHMPKISSVYRRVEGGHTKLEDLSEDQRHMYDCYLLIQDHFPDFASEVANKTEAEVERVLLTMKSGQNAARSTDTCLLKTKIAEMVRELYPEEPAAAANVEGGRKTNRGFCHDFFGELLCPCNMDWKDPKVKAELVATPQLASTAAWPLFFYPKGEFDPEDLCRGKLRGELILWAYKAIFLGPSTWYPSKGKTEQSSSCNASVHNMDKVTPSSIAYVAAQVRFALSSGESNIRSGGAFCQTSFYWHIMQFLQEPMFEEEVKELLEWWNSEIFPEWKAEQDTPADETTDSLQLMKKQAAAKRAGLTDLTNQPAKDGQTQSASNGGPEKD
ncbi:hypothetical protein M422DRAFT_245783, partial [Sphaerobolus stellatus SS14]